MPGLSRAWHAICRFITGNDTTIPDDLGRVADSIPLRGNRQHLRGGSRWLSRIWARFKHEMEDPQQRRERVRRNAMWQERRATRRALILLMKLMNPGQRQEFRDCRYFHVIGGSTGERYRIRVGTIANIDVLRPDGAVKHRLCARPSDDVPVYDVMAAQLLHLQDPASEQRFLLQANIQPTLPEDRSGYRATWVA